MAFCTRARASCVGVIRQPNRASGWLIMWRKTTTKSSNSTMGKPVCALTGISSAPVVQSPAGPANTRSFDSG